MLDFEPVMVNVREKVLIKGCSDECESPRSPDKNSCARVCVRARVLPSRNTKDFAADLWREFFLSVPSFHFT